MTDEQIPNYQPKPVNYGGFILIAIILLGATVYFTFFDGLNEEEMINITIGGDNMTDNQLCEEMCENKDKYYYTLRDWGYGNVKCYCKSDNGNIWDYVM